MHGGTVPHLLFIILTDYVMGKVVTEIGIEIYWKEGRRLLILEYTADAFSYGTDEMKCYTLQ